MDWEWYLQHYDTPMRFGATSEESWTLAANAGNLVHREPPSDAPLQTPVGSSIQAGKLIANIMPQFPNRWPELVQQCGFEMKNESGTTDSRARYVGPNAANVDEVIRYANLGVRLFVGVDADSLKTALQDNDQSTNDDVPETVAYSGAGIASDRAFVLSEVPERPVLIVETADEEEGSLGPAVGRVADVGTAKSAFELESIKWCLSEFSVTPPVIVWQLNGGRAKFTGTNYQVTPHFHLNDTAFDSVLLGFDTQGGTAATAHVAISHADGEVISEQRLRDVYGEGVEDENRSTTRRPHVAALTDAWNG